MLTHREAATILECSLGALYRLVHDGRIVPVKSRDTNGVPINLYLDSDVERLRVEREPGRRVSRKPVSEATLNVVRRMRKDGYAWRHCAAVAHVGVPTIKELLGEG